MIAASSVELGGKDTEASDSLPAHGDAEEGINLADAPAVEECWADYCPCDTSDPDFGYLDVTLCRKINMGMPVSDDEFSIGAGGRDARKALREFERDNP